jgi:hypothetical protein
MSAEPIDRLNSDRMPSFALCLESRRSTQQNGRSGRATGNSGYARISPQMTTFNSDRRKSLLFLRTVAQRKTFSVRRFQQARRSVRLLACDQTARSEK